MICDRCLNQDKCHMKSFLTPLTDEAQCSRFKKIELATNRMIMMFCSKGLGEWTYDAVQCTGNQWSYYVGDEDEPVSESLRIRPWDTLEWSIPTKDYIEQLLRD